MNTFVKDLQFASRTLLRAKGFTAVAVVSLGLAIGATTAIFSVVNGVLLTPLPFPDADRLVRVMVVRDAPGSVSFPDFVDWSREIRAFERVAAWVNADFNLSFGDSSSHVRGMLVSQSYLRTLGVVPLLGRDISSEEDRPGGAPVALLSEALWRTHFASDPEVIGRTVVLDGLSRTVIGVVPATISAVRAGEVLLPLAKDLAREKRTTSYLNVVGRLRAGVSTSAARAELEAVTRSADAAVASRTPITVQVTPWQAEIVGNIGALLTVLLAIVGFVLLLACANVMHLLLARGIARSRELSIRAALGAGRRELVSQLFAESLILALAAGVLGVLLGKWILDSLLGLGLPLPRFARIRLDGRVLAVTAGVSLATACVFGLLPAWTLSRPNLMTSLNGAVSGTTGRRHARLRSVLVAAEMALALVPLVGAGLLLQSFGRLLAIDPGFRPEKAVSFRISLGRAHYGNRDGRAAYAETLRSRIRGIAGVEAVGAINDLPLGGSTTSTSFQIEGEPLRDPNPVANYRVVTPGYLTAMGIALRSGRDFEEEDRAATEPVALVSAAFAYKFLPQGALDRRIKRTDEPDSQFRRIVGVVADVRHADLGSEPAPAMYIPLSQGPVSTLNWVVRSQTDPMMVVPALRAAVKAQDPDQPAYDIRTVQSRLLGALANQRLGAWLLSAFAVLAVLLAVGGVASVMAHGVSERTREIGIRRAFGASRRSAVWLVLRQGVGASGAGAVLGTLGAVSVGRGLSALLYGVSSADPFTLAAGVLFLMAVAATAAWIPASWAAKVDPQVALRAD